MSLYNILGNPRHRKVANHKVMKDRPPLIKDILEGKMA